MQTTKQRNIIYTNIQQQSSLLCSQLVQTTDFYEVGMCACMLECWVWNVFFVCNRYTLKTGQPYILFYLFIKCVWLMVHTYILRKRNDDYFHSLSQLFFVRFLQVFLSQFRFMCWNFFCAMFACATIINFTKFIVYWI